MKAEEMREILRREYGISSLKEFNKAVESSQGVNLGLFTKKEVKNSVRVMSAHSMLGEVSECTGTAKVHL